MELVSKKQLVAKKEELYFQKFTGKNKIDYGLRFGNPNDAEIISEIFEEIYDYQYVNPIVYDIDILQQELQNKNNFWFLGEVIENREITGVGLVEKKRYIAHAGKAVVRKKFQGLGVATKIAAAGIIALIKTPQFKDVLRVDSDVRGPMIRSQKLIQMAGAIPYALIPGYNNFADKRFFEIDDNKPFPPKKEESAFFYSIIFKKLWKLRDKTVYLLDNEDFFFFYDYVKTLSNKMNNDILILERERKGKSYELYGVSKDPYNGIVKLYGYINEKSLYNLIKNHSKWRIILWRIPTTQNGISSMNLAIQQGFKVVGYDIGFNNINWTLFDSVILAYYPNNNYTLLDIEALEITKPMKNKINDLFTN
ncbi:MAG: hypothetical protein HWN81_06710 [Candidatus Lokiarchaeota archaeon]|nr:hypothetical protein [Candidatus Lokiarchaeota archaeon]